jgi:hypothetical protein
MSAASEYLAIIDYSRRAASAPAPSPAEIWFAQVDLQNTTVAEIIELAWAAGRASNRDTARFELLVSCGLRDDDTPPTRQQAYLLADENQPADEPTSVDDVRVLLDRALAS